MGPIDPEISLKLQPDLLSGESLLWTGQPNPGVIFHSSDWFMIPFSLFWGGFSMVWEGIAMFGLFGNHSKSFAPLLMAICGIPFFVIGQYLIWGRFFYDGWVKRRTYYAVTNRRVLVVQEGRNRKISSAYIDAIPSIEKEGATTGTIWFGPKYPVIAPDKDRTRNLSSYTVGDVPVFMDVDDSDYVYHLVSDLRDQLTHRESVFAQK